MKGMTVIVKTISSWVKVLIFLFGIYIILFGDISPGGGFAGGIILASCYVLLMLAFGREYIEENLPISLALKLLCAGVLIFLLIALSGLFYGPDGFFWNFIYQKYVTSGDVRLGLPGAGTIPLAEAAIGLLVGASLFLVIFTFSGFRPVGPGNEKE